MSVSNNENGSALTAERLKARSREERDSSPQAVNLRVHRAISWLSRAEKEAGDPDAAMIFYWIAFNAAYAREQESSEPSESEKAQTERARFRDFFELILKNDADSLIYDEIWERFSGPIRLLLDNHYVFQPFWDSQRVQGMQNEWRASFERSKNMSHHALAQQDTLTVLTIVFDRLYVLRNQLIHGGATWDSSLNRRQVEDGARILSFLVPLFVSVMMDNPDEEWGEPAYPPVDGMD